MMERKIITKPIDHRYVGKKQPRWKDLKHSEYQEDDLIHIGYEEDEYGNDGGWFISVERERLETDEEYNERMKRNERFLEDSKKQRYERYLKLKEEFENGNVSTELK
jgi:hypothetical protein